MPPLHACPLTTNPASNTAEKPAVRHSRHAILSYLPQAGHPGEAGGSAHSPSCLPLARHNHARFTLKDTVGSALGRDIQLVRPDVLKSAVNLLRVNG